MSGIDPTSVPPNTKDVFRAFVGQKLIGVMFNAMKTGGNAVDHATLIFENGEGITLTRNGNYWVNTSGEIDAAAAAKKAEVDAAKKDIDDVIAAKDVNK